MVPFPAFFSDAIIFVLYIKATLPSDTIKKNGRKDGSIFAKWIEQRVLEELVRLMSMTSWSSLGRARGLPGTLLVASASVLPVAEEELPPTS